MKRLCDVGRNRCSVEKMREKVAARILPGGHLLSRSLSVFRRSETIWGERKYVEFEKSTDGGGDLPAANGGASG